MKMATFRAVAFLPRSSFARRLTAAACIVGGLSASSEVLAAAGPGSLRNQAFQAIDDQTVYVLSADGNLWREHGNSGARDWVDGNVRAFQAIDTYTVFVLGNDATLWQENGNMYNRTLIDSAVVKFQHTIPGETFVLGFDGNLWREHPDSHSKDLVDGSVRTFHARSDSSPETIYVLGSDGTLWREHGSSNTRDWVDAAVRDFQDMAWSETEVDVLGYDGNLWKEYGNMHNRTWIDGFVRSFQDIGGSPDEIYVLSDNGTLWAERGSMSNRSQVDGAATAFQALGAQYPGMVYVLGADGKLWRERGTWTNRDAVDGNVYSATMMDNPQVVLILWGHDYVTNSSLTSNVEQAFGDIVSGSFMNGLYQYGIGRGEVVSTVVIDEPLPKPGTRPARSWQDIQNNVVNWLNNGTVPIRPSVNDNNVMYFVVPPAEYELYLGSDPTVPSLGIQGLHWHTKYRSDSTRDDTVIATGKTYHPDNVPQFMLTTDVFGHELVESFNDPYGGRTELGDPCINDGDWLYLGKWSMQQYWSAQRNACIDGDTP
jgi:hypothetical protein